jgi:sensor histidine kinase YesM
MLKSKHELIIFKKIVFQFFYFSFIVFFVSFFIENKLQFPSNFEKGYVFIEMLLFCYLVFYVNSSFFAKKMVANNKYISFFIKNTLFSLALILGCYFLRMVLKTNSLFITNEIWYLYLLFGFFTLAISLFYSDWMYQIENKAAMYRLIKEKNKFEVELLKSQFSPHFLFNTLNSIYSKCHSTSPDAAVMIHNLSNFMRYLIYDCSSQRVLISKEVTFIDDFIKLYKLNYSSDINITFKHKLFDEGQRIAPMLLLNFIENAFKHSQVGVSKESYVKIELATDQDLLYFKVKNNKVTLQNKLEKGIGNHNTISRLELDYIGQYEYEVTDLENLYTVNLKIRL